MSTTSRKPLTLATTADIRACFPALERVHNQLPVAYFDGPGGTQVPRQVVEAMNDYLYHHNANTHWAYPTSEETDAALERARKACADLLNASPREIAHHNPTEHQNAVQNQRPHQRPVRREELIK